MAHVLGNIFQDTEEHECPVGVVFSRNDEIQYFPPGLNIF